MGSSFFASPFFPNLRKELQNIFWVQKTQYGCSSNILSFGLLAWLRWASSNGGSWLILCGLKGLGAGIGDHQKRHGRRLAWNSSCLGVGKNGKPSLQSRRFQSNYIRIVNWSQVWLEGIFTILFISGKNVLQNLGSIPIFHKIALCCWNSSFQAPFPEYWKQLFSKATKVRFWGFCCFLMLPFIGLEPTFNFRLDCEN